MDGMGVPFAELLCSLLCLWVQCLHLCRFAYEKVVRVKVELYWRVSCQRMSYCSIVIEILGVVMYDVSRIAEGEYHQAT